MTEKGVRGPRLFLFLVGVGVSLEKAVPGPRCATWSRAARRLPGPVGGGTWGLRQDLWQRQESPKGEETVESGKHSGWKRPLRPSRPTFNPAVTSPR